MRLWSLHPEYLDAKGLVALWREGLLARKVLEGRTRGYRRHPQLERFRQSIDPVELLDSYLSVVYDEARRRGYHFDRTKIRYSSCAPRRDITQGQLEYEWAHLEAKLARRSPERSAGLVGLLPHPHPIFRVVPGPIETWEIL